LRFLKYCQADILDTFYLENSVWLLSFTDGKKMFNTETAIDDLVAATCGENATAREKHVCREALRGLVRLARSEHLCEMKANVEKLTGAAVARAARRHAKAILLAQRLASSSKPEQKPLEFNQR
jgi:hypothetical protein